MNDFSINEMQEMQQILQDKYEDKWEPICPETGEELKQVYTAKFQTNMKRW